MLRPKNYQSFSFVVGICYEFEIMDAQESPNVPFTIFRIRYLTGKKSDLLKMHKILTLNP